MYTYGDDDNEHIELEIIPARQANLEPQLLRNSQWKSYIILRGDHKCGIDENGIILKPLNDIFYIQINGKGQVQDAYSSGKNRPEAQYILAELVERRSGGE